ncbi:MAG: mannose-phosphate guanylyltransferase / phosphomannomutase [Actinomycetota bacterium]|nr:mannose-phosphate guanylyltransferase / phosphomannomutase [Actinomycetota bacterium]
MDIVGVILVGGRGERARPITVKAAGYLRSKAAMSFCGKRLIVWLLEGMRRQGVHEFFVVALGKENRYQTKTLVGHGDDLGLNIRYSRVRHDRLNTGSGDATLRSLEYWDIESPALICPADSLYDFSLARLLASHHQRGALLTVAGMARSPSEVAGKYGVMIREDDGRVTHFLEKPSLNELRRQFHAGTGEGAETLMTNAGMYLMDSAAMRKYAHEPELRRLRERRLDFGMDLLPWAADRGLAIYAEPVDHTGDLGTVVDYIETTVDLLRGAFPTLSGLMGTPYDAKRRLWIPAETLQFRDEMSGKSLEEKLEEGLVTLGDNVRLGRYVEIGPGVTIRDSNVDDGVDIGPGVTIEKSAVRDGAIIGAGATLSRSYVGSMAEIGSTEECPTVLEEYVAVGDEALVQPGARLRDRISIYPRLKIPATAAIPPGTEIRDANDVLRWL